MSCFTLSWTCTATREPANWQQILLSEQEHETHMAGHSLSGEKEETNPAPPHHGLSLFSINPHALVRLLVLFQLAKMKRRWRIRRLPPNLSWFWRHILFDVFSIIFDNPLRLAMLTALQCCCLLLFVDIPEYKYINIFFLQFLIQKFKQVISILVDAVEQLMCLPSHSGGVWFQKEILDKLTHNVFIDSFG